MPARAPVRLPDFLIIGAMKAGTTTLYSDLGTHPRVFFPADKEPDNLAYDEVLSAAGTAAYGRLFRQARPDQICGEASTAYSKLPDFPGVAERAHRLLGDKLRILYLVREPVSRVVSQHYHDLAGDLVDPSIDRAVREHPRLIQYSLYAMQLCPWLDLFGPRRVRVVRFESFVEDRQGVTADVLSFLGLKSWTDEIDPERVHNPAELLRARRGLAYRLSRGALYRRLIRRWLPPAARTRLRRRMTPPAPPRPAPPSLETVDYILDAVRDDAAELQRLAGWSAPLWDLDAVRRRWAAPAEAISAGR